MCKACKPMERSLVFKKGIKGAISQESHGSSLHLRLPVMHWGHFFHFTRRKPGLRLYLECTALRFSSFTILFCKGGRKSRDWEGQGGKGNRRRAHDLSLLQSWLPALGANSPFLTWEGLHPQKLRLQVWIAQWTHEPLKAKTTAQTNQTRPSRSEIHELIF